ncbi:unnamed protein product [Lactuca virosa]|uniref:SWIM-type domain-containing protein n=1 Tax=Lactuca virosa TaxID=75947 RepID=A0AAU9MBV2_9ASTR|nr:unnamed protein product [Lactuca virosa]
METVDDFDTIDVELDEFFKHKQRSRCKDEFLNTLTDEALDECTIPEINLNDFEGMSEDEAPQEKQSDSEGDDEDKLQFQYSTHDPKVKWNNMKPVLGERYESPHKLKFCLTNYSISRGYPIRFKKCDSVRLVAVCASDPEKFECPFVVRASWMSTERSFQIKKMVEQHTCVRNFRSANLMDPTWIARQFLKEMIRKPNLKCKEMQAIIQSRSWYVHPSGLNAFEVRNGFHSYGVNLEGMYCTCRLWELSGMPCVHAQATIIYTQQDPARFISTWFGKDKFLATYESNILPVNGSNMWEPTPYTKPLPPIERRMPGRPCGRRGGGRGGRSGGRVSTSVYEEGESSGKKEPGIETQFVTQTTPNVESQFVTQTAPTVDSEHVPETQEADVNIDDEGDGLDMADLDQILHDLSYLRESKYSEAEILLCLNITQSQLKGFDALLHQSKQAAKEDNGENKEESDYEDGVEESQEDNDEDGAEDDEEGVDDTQVRVRTQVRGYALSFVNTLADFGMFC